MDINQHPFLHKDPPSECRSFGTSYRACSQPRKISRGIPIDTSAKVSSSENANKGVLQSEECLNPTKADPVEVGNRIDAINSTDSGKYPRSVVHGPFLPVPTGSFHWGIPVSEVAHGSTESNRNQNSLGQLISMVTARNDAEAAGIEKPSFANSQEVVIEDITKEAENRGRETLRVKLWEILGTVSSPKQHLNDYDLKVGAKDSESPQQNNGERCLALKSKQNSDPIESDSEFPNEKTVRLPTYSLSKKRDSDELEGNRSRNAQSSLYEEAEGKNTARFREGSSERISHGIHGGSLKKKNKSEEQDSAEACKAICLDQGNEAENQLVKNQRKLRPSGKRSFSHEYGGENYKEFFSGRKIELMEPNSVALQRNTHRSPLMNLSDKLKSVTESPKLQEKVKFIENVDFSFLRSTTNEKVDAISPIFEMRTPTKMSSPCFLPTEIKTPSVKFSDDCGSEGMAVEQRGILCFKNWLDCKSNFYGSNYQKYSSDDAGENDDVPTVKVEEPGTSISRSSNQESDSDTSEEDAHAKGCTESEFHFLKTSNDEKLTNVLHLNKKRRYLDGSKISGFSPTFASRKGVEELRNLEQHTDLKQEHGLPREVALFMLTLKRFKSKMNSVVAKRSAEILKSVAENINSQLKNVEFQMQVDAGKLVNHSKSKRKCLQIKYQELQGNLKTLHERFKEEANQHLQLCKTTVEGLEAQQMELKEKQRASSRELLLQTEAAIETELIDAQRKITMIRNSVREKMLQLKNIVADCLREGDFS